MEVHGASQKKKNQQFGRLNSNRSSNDTNDYGSLFAGLFELPRSISILPFFLSHSLIPLSHFTDFFHRNSCILPRQLIYLLKFIFLVEREIMSFHPIIIVQKLCVIFKIYLAWVIIKLNQIKLLTCCKDESYFHDNKFKNGNYLIQSYV